jgi:hypothetical protein
LTAPTTSDTLQYDGRDDDRKNNRKEEAYMPAETTMRFCENGNCDEPDAPIERISDYHFSYIIDGLIICKGCAEREEAGIEEDSHGSVGDYFGEEN